MERVHLHHSMLWFYILLCCITLFVIEQATSGAQAPELKEKSSFRVAASLPESKVLTIAVADAQGFLALPRKRKQPTPWVWYAPTFDGQYPDASFNWFASRLLSRGVAIAGIDVGESFGNPKSRTLFSRFYRELVSKHGLSRKACLLPQSRGGLMLYNWAAENPAKVACIAGIYTVCDMSSWPGLEQAAPAYGMTADELRAVLPQHNPIERLAPLAARRIPILHIHGDADDVVPLEANSAELARRYRALGGKMELLVVPGKGHEECKEFFQDRRVLEFILRHSTR